MKYIILLVLTLICLQAVFADNETTTITVVYDNNEYNRELETEWGFSCVVRHNGKSFLFDTGGRWFDRGDTDSIFFNNMKKLHVEPKEFDAVMLSNIDHVGGMPAFLNKNSNVIAYIPGSFHKMIGDKIGYLGAQVEKVIIGRKLFDDFYTTGELGERVKEQALIIDTKKGIIVIVGSAHPGIIEIVEKAKKLFKKEDVKVGSNFRKSRSKDDKKEVLLVMGGFNLREKKQEQIKEVIAKFKKLNVKFVGPCQNSGDKARRLFKKAYGKRFIEIGVGKVIRLSTDLINGGK